MKKNPRVIWKMTYVTVIIFVLSHLGTFLTDVWAASPEVKAAFPYKMPVETNQEPDKVTMKELSAHFLNPPESVKTGVYWYWISSNISKEGVVKDLHAMKKAGINRAYIGDIGVDNVKRGPIKTLSEQWWDIIHVAVKTATELDMEIGIFNSPGWSQSGGPWVDYTRAMRYLVSSELRVSGPKQIQQKLEQPAKEFQDVKVLAWPEPENDTVHFTADSTNVDPQVKKLLDGDIKTGVSLPAQKETSFILSGDKPFTARSLMVYPMPSPITAHAELSAKIDGNFKPIIAFEISRYNPEINVGFLPWSPITVSFPTITASEFKFTIKSQQNNAGIAELVLNTAPRIAAFSEKTLAKMHQTPQPKWTEYQWPVQPIVDDPATMVDTKKIIDISDKMAEDGTLNWNVPEGNWVIMRTGMTPTGTKNAPAVPEATGYETDKMSREHIYHHFESLMGEVLKRIPAEERQSFKIVVQDSYEVGGQNFTDQFFTKFQNSFGYDPTPYLPAYFGYVIGNQNDSDRFLWDLRRFIADEISYNYVGGLRDISNKHGLKTWLECYGHWGFPGEFLQYGGQSDEIAGEYWSEGTLGDIENRIASSCGHIYGKKQIWAESNTCAGNPFGRSPVNMKQRTDRFFSEGINNTLLHLYIQQASDDKVPGVNAWFGNEFNRHNTWFCQMDLFTSYLKRCNYMLQQGLNIADVAYFIGEDAPKMIGAVDPPIPNGYQYDFMNAEVIEYAMGVQDGLITLPHGTQYRVLVLPKLETMRPELLRKIDQLVKDGAIVLGPKPTRSPSLANQPEADLEVKRIADLLWGAVDGKAVKSRKVGKGMIANGLSLEELFTMIQTIPDCRIPVGTPLVYGHRHLDNTEIYFIANQSDQPISNVPLEFRITGKIPELWSPLSGTSRILPNWKQSKNTTTVSLDFASQESYFIVFQQDSKKKTGTGINFPKAYAVDTLIGPWSVQFDAGKLPRGPKETIIFDKLTDWAKSSDSRIKYFSGTAIYRTEFEIENIPQKQGQNIILSLGDIAEMAKIKVNGKYIGGVWTFPYQIDITRQVKQGTNTLEIEVVNTWVNRLIGDLNLPEEQRPTWCPVNSWKKDSPLKKSGLIGPVQLQYMKY